MNQQRPPTQADIHMTKGFAARVKATEVTP